MFSRILIANRGAIARRVVQACRKLGIESVVLFSEPDAGAPYLTEADQAHPLPGNTAQETYLNQDAVLAAIRTTGADALHPGYGFLAENAGFAEAVERMGVRFIGPRPNWLATMGDKVAARNLAESPGFPVFAGSDRLSGQSAAGDLAYEYGVNKMVLAGPEGDLLDKGKYLLVWRKTDGEWYIAALCFTSDAPAPVPLEGQ